jgi:hypothetical protein
MVDDPLITVAEAARKVGVSHTTLGRQIKTGQVRSHGKKVKLSEVLEDRANNIDASIWEVRKKKSQTVTASNVHAHSESVHAQTDDDGEIDADLTDDPEDGAILIDGVALPISRAKALKETYLARLRKLEFDEKSGLLVSGDTVEKLAFEWERGARDYWSNWPAQAAPIMAPELGVDQVKLAITLEQFVRKHLAERAAVALRLASKG